MNLKCHSMSVFDFLPNKFSNILYKKLSKVFINEICRNFKAINENKQVYCENLIKNLYKLKANI